MLAPLAYFCRRGPLPLQAALAAGAAAAARDSRSSERCVPAGRKLASGRSPSAAWYYKMGAGISRSTQARMGVGVFRRRSVINQTHGSSSLLRRSKAQCASCSSFAYHRQQNKNQFTCDEVGSA